MRGDNTCERRFAMLTAILWIVFGVAILGLVVWALCGKPPKSMDAEVGCFVLIVLGLLVWAGVHCVSKGMDRLTDIENRNIQAEPQSK